METTIKNTKIILLAMVIAGLLLYMGKVSLYPYTLFIAFIISGLVYGLNIILKKMRSYPLITCALCLVLIALATWMLFGNHARHLALFPLIGLIVYLEPKATAT